MGKQRASEPTFQLVYDIKQFRPGCVLIQAAGGGDTAILKQFFDSECWLLAPTPGMRMVEGTAAYFAKLATVSLPRGVDV